MTPLTELVGVTKAYSTQSRVEIGDVAFAAGDRVFVAGANGSGKSTLLRIVAGVSQPSSGLVRRSDAWRASRIGFVPQSGGLYDDVSVAGNFEIRRYLYGTTPDRDRVVDALGLGPWLAKCAGELSGGFRRVVAVAAALSVQPDVLIMDEPFDGVDDDRRGRITELLDETAPRLRLLVTAAPFAEPQLPNTNGILTLGQGRVTWARR